MKVKKLIIQNIGLIADANIALDQPLILFYGDIRAGKTTYLNAVRWCFGGSFPADIIRHGETSAFVSLEFDNGMIKREFYVGKTDGITKARPLTFIQDGRPVPQPVQAIEKLLNPYLLDQNFLLNKTERERRTYFANLFAVDTATLDDQAAIIRLNAERLRAKISGYGAIDITPVPVINVEEIREKIGAIQSAHDATVKKVISDNDESRKRNSEIDKAANELDTARKRRQELHAQLAAVGVEIEAGESFLAVHLKSPLCDLPEIPTTVAALQADLSYAIANNVRAEQAEKNLQRASDRRQDEIRLAEYEQSQRKIKEDKIAKLAAISATCGIPGLRFNEEGDFSYGGSEAGMLSTSQIMELSSLLSDKYPQGFGIDLIDRGESLGTSIFRFVERAKSENKTILATIVGERPTTVPAEVGVFVVEQGKAS